MWVLGADWAVTCLHSKLLIDGAISPDQVSIFLRNKINLLGKEYVKWLSAIRSESERIYPALFGALSSSLEQAEEVRALGFW